MVTLTACDTGSVGNVRPRSREAASQHNIEIRNESVYNALMVCCGKSAPGSIPSTFDIASEVMTQKRCDCFNGIEPGSTIRAAEHTLLHHSSTSCHLIVRALAFFIVEQYYPIGRQIYQMEMHSNVVLDPGQNEPSAKRPCPGLERLKKYMAKKHVAEGCCICQCDITRGSNMIKLTPCGHIFHDKNRKCENPGLRKMTRVQSVSRKLS